MSELYLGLMSGTSIDAVDAVLVDMTASPRLLASHSHTIPEVLKGEIMALCRPGPNEVERLGPLDRHIAYLFADAALTLLGKTGIPASAVRAIGHHGQTVRHHPDGPEGFTLQLGDANTLAVVTGIPVVADFRRKDIALGGQGAPLVPAFHNAVFRSGDEDRVIVNIGGIANVTVLPKSGDAKVYGFDTGPGNTLLDAWSREHRGQAWDEGGAWAARGKADPALVQALLADPYFARPAPKSTGREYFHLDWLRERTGTTLPRLRAVDVQASLLELSARSIADAVQTVLSSGGVYLCGGGVHNRRLYQRLVELLPSCRVADTDSLGIGADWVEAMAFAWLAQRHVHGQPGNLPEVTGARRSAVLGAYYPA